MVRLFRQWHQYGPLRHSLFRQKAGKWGFNFHEKSIIPARYDNVVPLSDNSPVFWAQDKGKWGLVGRYGQLLIPFIFDDVDVSLQPQTNQKTGYKIDGFKTFDGVAELDGTFLQREWRYMPEDGAYFPLLPVCKDGKWGYVDMEGKTVIDFDYDEAHVFNQYFNDNKRKAAGLLKLKKDVFVIGSIRQGELRLQCSRILKFRKDIMRGLNIK